MTRIFFLLLIALICAPAALAQDRDYSRYEFYVGYANERANNNADRFDRNGTALCNGAPVDFRSERASYNGFMVEFNQNVTRHLGIVTSFSGTYDTTGYFDQRSGRTINARVQRYDLMAGPRYNWRNSSPFIPYVHALFGVARYQAKFRNGDFSCPDTSETAFAMALGGGLDIRASKHIDVRAGQVDYLPVFFSHKREDGLRFSAGVKIKP